MLVYPYSGGHPIPAATSAFRDTQCSCCSKPQATTRLCDCDDVSFCNHSLPRPAYSEEAAIRKHLAAHTHTHSEARMRLSHTSLASGTKESRVLW